MMITIYFVTISLVVAFAISLALITCYYFTISKVGTDKVSVELGGTDACVPNGIEEIKIICK